MYENAAASFLFIVTLSNVRGHLLFIFILIHLKTEAIKSSITKVVKKGKHGYPEKAFKDYKISNTTGCISIDGIKQRQAYVLTPPYS